MEIRELENLIRNEIDKIVIDIIENNQTLNISAKSRAGAEISDWLENCFIEYTINHKYLKNSQFAPKGKTKNPWDVRTFFQLNDLEEEIWIDFKAFKTSGKDSNPDIGTPDKIIKFIEKGGFYLLYIYVYYEECDHGLKFVKQNAKFTKAYFLKDISPTVRRTSTNQLQINIAAESVYRTRDEFIELLMEKLKEGLIRQLRKAEERLKQIEEKKLLLKQQNAISEHIISQKIQ